MTALAAETGLEVFTQQLIAENPALDAELENLCTARPSLVQSEAPSPTPEAQRCLASPQLIGNLALNGVRVTSLSEAIGVEAQKKVEKRYSAMLDRVAEQLGTAEGPKKPQPFSTVEMFASASRGEERGREALLMNVSTHTNEIVERVGAVIVIKGKLRADGQIEQLGQTHEDRQEQTLASFPNRTAALSQTTHAEGRNVFGIEEGRQALRGKWVVEQSAMSDEETAENLAAMGYFLPDMMAIARFTGFDDAEESEEVETRSLLLGGVDVEAVEGLPENPTDADTKAWHERLLKARYDTRVFVEIRKHLKRETPKGMTANQMLADASVLGKAYDEVDYAMLYDFFASKEVAKGKQTFFGSVALWRKQGEPQVLTRKMYEERLAEVAARTAERKKLNEQIVDLALERYNALPKKESIKPLEAAELLRKATLDLTVSEAVKTYQDIELPNLGTETWDAIQAGRAKWNAGDRVGAEQDIARGQVSVVDPACPTGPNGLNNTGSAANSGSESGGGKRRMKCPFCKDPNQYGDPCAPIIECTNCHARVVHGQLKSRGDGGQSARKARTTKAALIGSARMNLSGRKPEHQKEVRHVTGWLSLKNI